MRISLIEQILNYRSSNRIAIVDGNRTITYQKLINDALLLSSSLPNRGVPIGLKFHKNYEYIVSLLAVYFSQDFFVPLYLGNPKERIDFIVNDLSINHFLEKDNLFVKDDDSEFILSLEKEIEYAMYTSGSTGVPKGVKVNRKGLENTIIQQSKIFGYNKSNCYLFLSINFDASLSDIFCSLYTESTIYIDESASKSPKSLVKFINDKKITHLDIPPSFLRLISPYKSSLKTIIVGGEAPSVDSVTQWSKFCDVFNVYGPTECSICTSIEKISPDQKEISIGTPLNNVTYLLPGEELLIGGVGVATEYINRPDLNYKFKKINGQAFFRTGDLVIKKGDKLFFQGRKDSQIKHNGQMVNLQELEHVCLKESMCKNAIALYVDETIFLIYEGMISEAQLRNHINQYVPKYMIPHFIFNYRIEKNVNGKNDYRLMKNFISSSLLHKEQLVPSNEKIGDAILVTGTNGLLGGEILRKIDKGKVIYALVRTYPKSPLENVQYLSGDLSKENFGLDPKIYNKIKVDVSLVIHCAGEVNNLKSYKELYDNNVKSVKNVIDFCLYGNKRLKHVSSLSTEVSMLDRKQVIEESITERKNNLVYSGYAQTKLESELLANQYDNVEIYRPGLVIGYQFSDYPRFLIKICELIKKHGEIPRLEKDLYIDLTPISLVVESILKKNDNKVVNASINLKLSLKELGKLFDAKEVDSEEFFNKHKNTLFAKMMSEVEQDKNLEYSIFETTGVLVYQNDNFISLLDKEDIITNYKEIYLKNIKDNV